MNISYNQQLVNHRESLGFTLKEAAKKMELSPFKLFLYEKGYFRPSKKYLQKIQRVYGTIDLTGENEYPQESQEVEQYRKPGKAIFIVSGIITILSTALMITGWTLFDKSITKTEAYFGQTYNQIRAAAMDHGNVGRDIVTDLEYTYFYNDEYSGRADITFYKTNSILYFNNASYSVNSSNVDYPDLGTGRFHYQFGGTLGRNSYVCTFTYKSYKAAMFFTTDVYFENKPIEGITNLNIIAEGHIPITNELVVTLFNMKINDATDRLSVILTNELGHSTSFYDDFLKDREQGRTKVFGLQLSGMILIFTTLVSLLVSASILIVSLIKLIKHFYDEIDEESSTKELPKDIRYIFGIPDFIMVWILRGISFISLIGVLVSSFGSIFFSMPAFFTDRNFLNACMNGLAGGIFIRQLVAFSSLKKKRTLLLETTRYTFFYVSMAAIETLVISMADKWGYSISDLVFNYVPGNLFLVAALNCVIFYFMFFAPAFIQKKPYWVRVFWRLISIIPFSAIVAITIIGNSYELFYGVKKNIYLLFWLSNNQLMLSIISILFIYSLFIIKQIFKKKYKKKANIFFNGNKFNLVVGITSSAIILVCSLVDLIFKGDTIAYYLGVGNNIWLLIFLPFTLLVKHGPGEHLQLKSKEKATTTSK